MQERLSDLLGKLKPKQMPTPEDIEKETLIHDGFIARFEKQTTWRGIKDLYTQVERFAFLDPSVRGMLLREFDSGSKERFVGNVREINFRTEKVKELLEEADRFPFYEDRVHDEVVQILTTHLTGRTIV